jgi:hypothetical protein
MAAAVHTFGLTVARFVSWAARYRGEVGVEGAPLTEDDFDELLAAAASEVCSQIDDVLGPGASSHIDGLDDGARAKARVRQVLVFTLLPQVHLSLYARQIDAAEGERLRSDAESKLTELLSRPAAFGLDAGTDAVVTVAGVPSSRDDSFAAKFRDTATTRLDRW